MGGFRFTTLFGWDLGPEALAFPISEVAQPGGYLVTKVARVPLDQVSLLVLARVGP